MYLLAKVLGLVDVSEVAAAPTFVLPRMIIPTFSLWAILRIVWPTVATIAEDYADVQAIGVVFDEEVDGRVWKSLVLDGVADLLSWLANPSTPYNESVGATQIAKNQRPGVSMKRFIPVIMVAALLAISAGFLGRLPH